MVNNVLIPASNMRLRTYLGRHVLRLFPPQEGKSLLIVAAEGGHELVLLTLLDGGADVNLVPEVCSELL